MSMTADVAMGPSAIRALLERPGVGREDVDAFLATHACPIVEGANCTFVWRGEADELNLLHMISGLPSRLPFRRIEDSDLWFRVMELPAQSRVEYKFERRLADKTELIEDPLNPLYARDPFGRNSVVHGEGYATPDWVAQDPEARPGTLEEALVPSRSLGREARVTIYLPARFRKTRRYPLLVLHDGGDFLAYAAMKSVLDNLIHRQDVGEMIVAFTNPGERLREYANDAAHAAFVAEELLPWLESRYPIAEEASARGLGGSSFGAVAALSTAARYPGRFGRLLLLSGSFAFTDIGPSTRGPLFEPVVDFVNAFRREPRRVSDQVFVACGRYESLIYENRSIVPLLQSTGMEVRYVEARDGHNWENWRDRMRDGLSWLYPGPLWLVYE